MTKSHKENQENLLKAILQKRNPGLLSLLDKIGRELLSPLEREQIQNTIADELTSSGTDAVGEINQYGIELDDLISFIARS